MVAVKVQGRQAVAGVVNMGAQHSSRTSGKGKLSSKAGSGSYTLQ